jgi:AraC-like DNA-binding protein
MHASDSRPIEAHERSGVLAPGNLARFGASWIDPDAAAGTAVAAYWAVAWALPAGEAVPQRIIDFPAVTLSVEAGDVPAPFVVTARRHRAWERSIAGRGSVFALRLRPAGLAALTDLDAAALPDERPITAADGRTHALLAAIADEPTPESRARRADVLVAESLAERPPTSGALLANAAVDLLTAEPRVRPGATVAAELGVAERTLQRALRATLGTGPNDVARRIRLQEVVRRLSEPGTDTAAVAGDLGYADQAHLITDFRRVTGITPGRYVRELAEAGRALQG